jgi:CMP-N-acetylneuraminic acid synthetase
LYKNRKILAVVPARGGSKGIALKNLREISGRPLVARVGDVLTELQIIDRSVVSTDHERIAMVAREAGIHAPFRRPIELAGDQISDVQVLTHALHATEADDGEHYDLIVMLQPTSPLREPEHVLKTIQKCIDEEFDAVWTVSPTDSKSHPLKQLTHVDGKLELYDPAGGEVVARQQLSTVYHRNGVAYAIMRECLLGGTILGKRTGAVVLAGHHISIDTEWDLELAEFIIEREETSQ